MFLNGNAQQGQVCTLRKRNQRADIFIETISIERTCCLEEACFFGMLWNDLDLGQLPIKLAFFCLS